MPETLTTYDPNEWRQDAACRDMDTAIFFPETEEAAAAAKAVCATCPVREACLQFALVTRQDDGVWGGLDENERRRLRRRRQEAARKAAA
ncbi:MAG TPA: WhiB family transcriptional regulator [Acidimicrobiales bacterium]|jgi:WhiB family redox-sensing transcriptional regulator|nr:WhiB family transcriptional regulator [Acidimicrobiales bacterium]